MTTLTQTEFTKDIQKYTDKVSIENESYTLKSENGAEIIISPKNGEKEFDATEHERQNPKYWAILMESIKQIEKGDVVVRELIEE